eukprot:scaffold46271_cov48-Phaeocystis_antarctica.AAC.1
MDTLLDGCPDRLEPTPSPSPNPIPSPYPNPSPSPYTTNPNPTPNRLELPQFLLHLVDGLKDDHDIKVLRHIMPRTSASLTGALPEP